MTFKNSFKTKRAQAVLEYTILFAVVLLALVASDFLGRVRTSFSDFFITARSVILGG